MSQYGSVASGRRLMDEDVEKRLGVQPVLARRVPAAGRGGRRIVTGTVAKSEISKVSLSGIKSLGSAFKQPKAMASGFKSGLASGRAGRTPLLSSANSGTRVGANVGQAIGSNPIKSGIIAGGGIGGMAMAGNGQRDKPTMYAPPPSPIYGMGGFGKRSYDPEGERRFRQGAGAAATGVGALELARRARRTVQADSAHTRDLVGRKGPQPKQPQARQAQEAARLKRLQSIRGTTVSRKGALQALGALGLTGASGALIRNRNEERWD